MCESDSELPILVRSQKQISFVSENRNKLLVNGRGDGSRASCLFARWILQQFSLVFGHTKFKPTSAATMPGAAPSALRSALDSSIQACNQASEPTTMTYILVLLLLCVSRRDLATKDARWVRCSSWSLGPRPHPPPATYNNSLAAERRGDCVRALWLYSQSNASIVTRTSVCTSHCCCCTRLSSVT